MLAATTAAADASDVRMLMQPEPGAAYVHGHYYLIPQPYAVVKRDIEQGFAATAGLRGFQPRDDSAPCRAWSSTGCRSAPAISGAAPGPGRPGRRAGGARAGAGAQGRAITPEEHAAFRDAIASQQDYADDTLKSVPFVTQPIARWSFQRTQGKSRAQTTTARSWTFLHWWTRRH